MILVSISLAFASGENNGNAYGHYDVGDASTFATLPTVNEWPEGVVVDYNRDLVYVTGPAASPTSGLGASWVMVYDLNTESLITTITVQGENLSGEHALVEGALGPDGNLYVNSTVFGVIKFTVNGSAGNYSWTQSNYTSSSFPILVPLPPVPGLPPSIPNGMAFGPNGELYVTDSMQGVLFMVPTGGGAPQPVMVAPSLGFFGGGRMGLNGIKLDPDREYLYFAFTGGVPFPGAPGANGAIYRLPVTDLTSAPQLVYTYGVNDIVDGLAFDKDDNLYVVLAGANAISVLSDLDSSPYESDFIAGPNGGLPFTQPSTISLYPHGKFALVVNHALDAVQVGAPVPNPSPFGVNKVYVGVRGDSLP